MVVGDDGDGGGGGGGGGLRSCGDERCSRNSIGGRLTRLDTFSAG